MFTDKKDLKNNFKEILISRTSIAVFLSLIIIGFSAIYTLNINNKVNSSVLINIIDIIISIPITIPLIIGYGSGNSVAMYLALLIEVILLSLILRLFIKDNFIDKLKIKLTPKNPKK